MNYQHHDLAAGRWSQLTLAEQMANIGSEFERALNWRAKDNADYSRRAFERALELMDLTPDVINGIVGVFDYIMKECTNNRCLTQSDFTCNYAGNLNGMINVRFPAFTPHIFMGSNSKVECLTNHTLILLITCFSPGIQQVTVSF